MLGEKTELFSLYFVMFNRRAAAFKPSLFLKVCLLFFCTLASPPVQMAGIWMLNFCLNVSFEKWNLKDEFFVCTFKCPTGPILPASLKTILSYPIQKSLIHEGCCVDEEWNVPKWLFQQNEIPIVLKLIIVPGVEFSTEKARKKLCARIVSVVTDRPVNSWPWRHGGHFGVPKQLNGGQENQPSENWTLFLCKTFLL